MSESKFRLRKEYLATYFIAELPPEGLPARFGVITSYNPNGRLVSDAVNLEADSKLKECLKSAKVRHFRVTGGSQDGSHQEPGFGIVIDDPNEAAMLARRFQQEAFFWIEDGEVYCVKVGEPTMHQVGSWSKRQLNTE
jgi:hypothetical protein